MKPWRNWMLLAALAALVAHAASGAATSDGVGFSATGFETKREIFTNTTSVRRLTLEEAKAAYPVRVRATVTAMSFRTGFFVQDETGPIYVNIAPGSTSKTLRPGQALDIEGVTDPGRFAPQIREQKRTVIAEGQLPAPQLLTYEQLQTGKQDCQYAEIEGIVRSVEVNPTNADVTVTLAMGRGRVEISVYDTNAGKLDYLVDARVRVRGVVSGIFNEKRQWMGTRFNLSTISNLFVERPAPKDAYATAVKPVRTLLQWDPAQAEGHRVKVSGMVTHFQPGHALYLREQQLGLQVQTKSTLAVKPGDLVEVLGFPALGGYSSVMEDGVFRVVGHVAEPAPLPATADQLLDGALDAGLVTVRGTLLETVQRRGVRSLFLQVQDSVFDAQVGANADHELLNNLSAGSVLELTGICNVRETTKDGARLRPTSVAVLVRSPQDIRIIRHAPWWTPERLVKALGVVTVTALAISGWVWLLRRRVRVQTGIIQEKLKREAVIEERTRIAQEFHDTLEQELTGVSLQLEAAASQTNGSPVSQQLEVAHRLLQRSQEEVRRSVWDLRRPAVEGGLAEALKENLHLMRDGSAVAIQYDVKGTPRHLPALTEHHLLRIGVEAATNSLRHARAKNIRMELAFESEAVRLRLQDDGSGFDPASAAGCGQGHFGLAGMQERAEKIGAQFILDTQPGNGTRIEIVVRDVVSAKESGPAPAQKTDAMIHAT